MVFYKLTSAEPVAEIVAEKIAEKLNMGQKVFWIVTGGSAIQIEATISQLLKNHDLTKLRVTLSDERFGPNGHPDSNWQQLILAGFELPGANLKPVLVGQGIQKTTEEFANNLAHGFAECDYSIGIFGIGFDGHTAGILPGSPHIGSNLLAVSYSDKDLKIDSPVGVKRGVDRITMTAAAIANLDEAVVCAFGKPKWPWLDKIEENLSLEQNPAQALKKAAKLSIYSDYKGVEI